MIDPKVVIIGLRGAHLIAVMTALLLAGTLAFGSFSYGESTRMPDAEVHELIDRALAKRGERAHREQTEAVADAIEVTKRVAHRRLRRATKDAYERGYESGNSAGYDAGARAGYASGTAAGRAQMRAKSAETSAAPDSGR